MPNFEIVVVVLLTAIFFAICIAAGAITRRIQLASETPVQIDISAIAHHVEVNSVLALTEHFIDNPELSANLAGYSQQVVDAALLSRVNGLGNSIDYLDTRIAGVRNNMAHSNNPMSKQHELNTLVSLRETAQYELNEANRLIQERHRSPQHV